MSSQYETLRNNLMNQLDAIEGCERIQKALNKTLPNDSEETDYDKWLQGSQRFFDDNKDLFLALMNDG